MRRLHSPLIWTDTLLIRKEWYNKSHFVENWRGGRSVKNNQLYPFERNRYYAGKLLTSADFEAEQLYMLLTHNNCI